MHDLCRRQCKHVMHGTRHVNGSDAWLGVAKKGGGGNPFMSFAVPGCKPEASLVPETRVAAAQHAFSFQAWLGVATTVMRGNLQDINDNASCHACYSTGWHEQAQHGVAPCLAC